MADIPTCMFLRRCAIGTAAAVLAVAAAGCSAGKATATAVQQQGAATTPSGSGAAFTAADAQNSTGATPCATRDVRLKPGPDNSDFNGTSHSGTYLILTNRSRYACSIPGLPQLTFLDVNGPVETTADLSGAKFMHPGPVVLPIVLQPKQSVTTGARWVSGSVFQDSLCYKLTGVTLALREGTAMTALTGQMCGERKNGVHYDLLRYGAKAGQ